MPEFGPTPAERLYGTFAYLRSEECYQEESYYNGWLEDDAFLRGLSRDRRYGKQARELLGQQKAGR